MIINKCVDYEGVLIFKCPVNRFHCSYIYQWGEMIMSIEIMVGYGLHLLSDHPGALQVYTIK